MAITTTRSIIKEAARIAGNRSIDADTKRMFIEELMTLAASRQRDRDRFGRAVYRLIALSLGSVAVLVVIFAFVVILTKHGSIDAAFYALGSAAVGALGGVLAPASVGASGGREATAPSATTALADQTSSTDPATESSDES
jgi:hypothetical protein